MKHPHTGTLSSDHVLQFVNPPWPNRKVMELRREFHGGGALSDPVAGEALLDAIRVLRENFARLQDGDALIVTYGHPADQSPDH
jgi:hypothetical protein